MDRQEKRVFDGQPPAARSRGRDEIAYILPMAAFLSLTQAGVWWPALYPGSYVAKTLVVGLLLAAGWRHYTKIHWDYWGLGAIVGVVGVVQWVGTEKLLLWAWADYPRLSAGVFDPTQALDSPWALWGFVAMRLAGAVLVVPVMEELFWRDFLWRQVQAPNDFKLAEVGEWDAKALLVVSALFATVHVQWMTALVWGLMVGGLLVWKRSLGACIVAHAVTNLLLGAYVLIWREWEFW